MFTYLQSSKPEVKTEEPTPPNTDQIALFKRALTAVPFSMALVGSSGSSKNSKRGKRSKGLVSRTYNPIASRPLVDVSNTPKTYTAHLRTTGSLLLSSTSVPTFVALNFTITNFSDSAPYLALFDLYRIDEIEFWSETQSGPANNSGNAGIIATAVDLDDSTTPTTFSSVEAHQSGITSNCFAGHYHKWVPHMAVAAYSGAFTSYSNIPASWIDSASPNVQHYGIKAAASTASSAATTLYEVRAKVSFRQSGV